MSKTLVAVLVTLAVVALTFLVGYLSWDCNMEAECTGSGYLGVALPVLCTLCAFFIGLNAGRLEPHLEEG